VPSPREPDALDLGVQRVIDEVVRRSARVANVERGWSDRAGMWFVEVTPSVQDAAPIHVGSSTEDDELNVTVGRSWFEIFGVQDLPATLSYLDEIVEAVLEGRVQETGVQNQFARIETRSGTVSVGTFHLPIPWRFRSVRQYLPYASA
jgi:hypothetical protein